MSPSPEPAASHRGNGSGVMKKDYLSDARLASVALPDLRAYLTAEGIADTHMQLASTKFALVALAEEKSVDLEKLLATIDVKDVQARQLKQRQRDALGKEVQVMQVAVTKDVDKPQKKKRPSSAASQAATPTTAAAAAAAAVVAAAAGAKDILGANLARSTRAATESETTKRKSKGGRKGSKPSAKAMRSPSAATAPGAAGASTATDAASFAAAEATRDDEIEISEVDPPASALSEEGGTNSHLRKAEERLSTRLDAAAAPAAAPPAAAPAPMVAIAADPARANAAAAPGTAGTLRLTVPLEDGTVHLIRLNIRGALGGS